MLQQSKFVTHNIELRVWPVAQVTGGWAFARYMDHLKLLAHAYAKKNLSNRGYTHTKTEGEDAERGHWLGIMLHTRVRRSLHNLPRSRVIWIRI